MKEAIKNIVKNIGAMLHVTTHTAGSKMEGIQSLGTSCVDNRRCRRRRKVKGSICEKCYANGLCQCRKSLTEHLIRNHEILKQRLLTWEEAASVDFLTFYVRIESFGDVDSVTQARNYLRIIIMHPEIFFGIWSKNEDIWLEAFTEEGKPKNCTFVYSSMFVNVVAEIDREKYWFIDHIFTVWDKAHYAEVIAEHPETECAGIKCRKCLKCYKIGTSFYINELKR